MNLPALCIRRPVMTTLLMMTFVIFGLFAFRQLPVAALPRVDFPTINVSARLPGASPETMASSVAARLERAVRDHLGHHLDDLGVAAELDLRSPCSSTSTAISTAPPSTCSRRSARLAGRLPRGAANAAELPEGQPGRPADPVPRAVVADRCRCRKSTNTPRTSSSSRSRRFPASRRSSSSARRNTRCAFWSNPDAVVGARADARATCSTASRPRTPTRRSARSWARRRHRPSAPPDR